MSDPEAVLRRISNFLGLRFETDMLEYHVGRSRTETGLSAKKAWLPPTPGLRDWRTQFSDDEMSLFETLVGDLLEESGYERTTGSPTDVVRQRADDCRRQWQIEITERHSRSGTTSTP